MEAEEVLLVSPTYVKSSTFVNYNVDDIDLSNAIKVAQNIYLRDIIGDRLLKKIKELEFNAIKKRTPNIDEYIYAAYKELLDNYIKGFLAYKTQANICMNLSYKIRNIGLAKDSDTNIYTPSYEEVSRVRHDLETYACDAANRMADYLNRNKEAFPEISERCACGEHMPSLSKRYANTNLFLNK